MPPFSRQPAFNAQSPSCVVSPQRPRLFCPLIHHFTNKVTY
ncbi:hypothetical protein A464_1737 [Salmonella bongori N268-08]|uniref:Uncharacterized protein n=1 Tax=Salmonella bongori N268-08 TaxID=1197719 RepID=S5NFA4_SALBN|nr:hypothetical protein A464_1737 [Salmonella bongori N268-08]